jgi:O-antigen/teichoic acid export membrane protein
MADDVTIRSGRVPFNAFVNALATALSALAGLLTLPFLIDRLGPATYGLWALIVVVTGYFLIFDSGFTGSVGRLIAGKRSLSDIAGLNAVVSTALFTTLPFCAVIALAASLVAVPFLWTFDVPGSQTADVQTALLLVGIAIAFSLPESIFYGLLWGYERFELQNLVEIGVLFLRTTMIFVFIDYNSTLTDLSLIAVAASATGFVARSYFCWVAEPRLSIGPRHWRRELLPELLVIGSWFAVLRLSRSRLQEISTFVVGHLLGAAAVTTFTIPKMLVAYSNSLAQSVTEVVAPHAAAHHFAHQHDKQRELFIAGGRYSLAISLYVFGGFVAAGLPFLNLWQHGNQIEEYQLLLILAAGEIVPLSQRATYSAVVGIGRHRRLALLALGEALVILVFGYLAAVRYGLVGVACAVAVSAFVFRGVLTWSYGCQLLNISLAGYARMVALPVIGPAAGAIGTLVLVAALFDFGTWVELCAVLLVYTLIYWAGLLSVLVGWRETLALLKATLAELPQAAFQPFGKSAPKDGRARDELPLPPDESKVQ